MEYIFRILGIECDHSHGLKPTDEGARAVKVRFQVACGQNVTLSNSARLGQVSCYSSSLISLRARVEAKRQVVRKV